MPYNHVYIIHTTNFITHVLGKQIASFSTSTRNKNQFSAGTVYKVKFGLLISVYYVEHAYPIILLYLERVLFPCAIAKRVFN